MNDLKEIEFQLKRIADQLEKIQSYIIQNELLRYEEK